MELQMKDGGSGVSVSDAAFGAAFNEPLVHQVVTAYMAGGRQGTKAQKSRAEVSGGGKKPWRQKGTGRARAGTIRSPLWRGGGTHFPARPRDYSQKVNKKMYRGAMRAILSELVRQDRLTVVESFQVNEPKTRAVADKLNGLGASGRSVIVVDGLDDNIRLGARNLEDVHCCDAAAVDPVSLVAADTVVASVAALRRLEGWLA